MASNYDRYKAYRNTKLNDKEAKQVDEAKEKQKGFDTNQTLEKVEGGFMVDGRFAPDPILAVHESIALDRASQQLDLLKTSRGKPYRVPLPDDLECVKRWPAVDPLGKYCDVDMSFAQREQDLRNYLKLRPDSVQQYVGKALDDIHKTSPRDYKPIAFLDITMTESCKEIQRRQRASKLALRRDVSDMLANQAKSYTNADEIKLYDRVLTTMEQLSGMRPGELDQDIMNHLNGEWNEPVPQNVLEARNAPSKSFDKINVDFPNLEHQLQQQLFCSPHHWGKLPPSGAALDKRLSKVKEQALESMVDRYACTTVNQTLNTYFNPMENKYRNSSPLGFNRGSLIAINGETVEERMNKEYRETHPGIFNSAIYEQWYQENCLRRTNELVAAALMSNDHVEAFIPDAQGHLPKEPVAITKTGYEPEPLQKVVLSKWDQFRARHGHHNKKIDMAARYENVMACRERMQRKVPTVMADESIYTPRSESIMNQYFGNHRPKPRGSMSPEEIARFQPKDPNEVMFKYYHAYERSGAFSACMMGMLSKGYSLEQIMDPNQLREEKRTMGTEYMAHMERNDERWIGQTLAAGVDKFPDAMNELAKKYDLSDPSVIRENCAFFHAVSHAAFDVGQNMGFCKTEFDKAAAEICTKRKEPVPANPSDAFFDRLNASYCYLTSVTSGIMSEQKFKYLSIRDAAGELGNIIGGRTLMEKYRADRAVHPDVPFSELYKDSATFIAGTAGSIIQTETFEKLSRSFDDPKNIQKLSEAFEKGTADNLFRYEGYDPMFMVGGTFTANLEACEKVGVKIFQTDKEYKAMKQQRQKEQKKQLEQRQKEQKKQEHQGQKEQKKQAQQAPRAPGRR